MKRRFLLLLSLGLGLAVASCDRTTTEDNTDPTPTGTDKTIKGSITANTTIKAIDKNILEGFVYVEAGATLTIEPGAVIKGTKQQKLL